MAASQRLLLVAVALSTATGVVVGLLLAAVAPVVLSVQPFATGTSSSVRPTLPMAPARPFLSTGPSVPLDRQNQVQMHLRGTQHPAVPSTPGQVSRGPPLLASLVGVAAAAIGAAVARSAAVVLLPASELPAAVHWPRRQALLSVPAAATLLAAAPSRAKVSTELVTEKVYDADSRRILEAIKKVLALEKGDPSMAIQVEDLCDQLGEWLAKYRREFEFEEEASYSLVYHAVRLVAGHYAAAGNTVPLDPDRTRKVLELISEAEALLARGQ